MNLDQQIQALIDNAPQDGTMPTLMVTIAPAFKQLASRLRHLQYFIAQTIDEDWAVTTLEHQTQANLQKTVVYAYATLKDVQASPYPMQDPQMMAFPVPAVDILFKMLTNEAIDSTIFFEQPGNLATGTEIQRQELTDQVQLELQKTQLANQIPPDIA
jgi:CRISPR/Cas system CMR subunit Cmr4 (Cas7 group RAMP superfamily)